MIKFFRIINFELTFLLKIIGDQRKHLNVKKHLLTIYRKQIYVNLCLSVCLQITPEKDKFANLAMKRN